MVQLQSPPCGRIMVVVMVDGRYLVWTLLMLSGWLNSNLSLTDEYLGAAPEAISGLPLQLNECFVICSVKKKTKKRKQ